MKLASAKAEILRLSCRVLKFNPQGRAVLDLELLGLQHLVGLGQPLVDRLTNALVNEIRHGVQDVAELRDIEGVVVLFDGLPTDDIAPVILSIGRR